MIQASYLEAHIFIDGKFTDTPHFRTPSSGKNLMRKCDIFGRIAMRLWDSVGKKYKKCIESCLRRPEQKIYTHLQWPPVPRSYERCVLPKVAPPRILRIPNLKVFLFCILRSAKFCSFALGKLIHWDRWFWCKSDRHAPSGSFVRNSKSTFKS